MGARIRVDLASEQSATLKMWAGSGKTEQRMALRARVILLAASGLTLKEIASETGLGFRILYQHGILTPLRAKSASKIDPLGSPLRCLGSPEAQGVPRGDADSGDDQKGPVGGATRWKIH